MMYLEFIELKNCVKKVYFGYLFFWFQVYGMKNYYLFIEANSRFFLNSIIEFATLEIFSI